MLNKAGSVVRSRSAPYILGLVCGNYLYFYHVTEIKNTLFIRLFRESNK